MKRLLTIGFAFALSYVHGQNKTTPTLKSILLEQLKTTHNVKDWFVPVNIALEDLTRRTVLQNDKAAIILLRNWPVTLFSGMNNSWQSLKGYLQPLFKQI